MRTSRIKVSPALGPSIYHCMSRTVNGAFLFDDVAKETLRKQLRQIADYCGVKILTYALLSNHFHILVRVPEAEPISDAELLRRFTVLYPKPSRYQQASIIAITAWMQADAPEAEAWRKQQLALMGDVSAFMKLLKQRFSVWYNRTHNRYGTLWSERFKSVLIEPKDKVVQIMAAYIDLNAVRARLVGDPKDYRFCGYGEAVAGGTAARAGLIAAVAAAPETGATGPVWESVQADYRQTLYGIGSSARPGEGTLAPEDLKKVVEAKGRLPVATVLRCRIRHFSDGAVLGSRAFVAAHLADYRAKTGRRRNSPPKDFPALADWGADLSTLRGLRSPALVGIT